MAIDKVGFNPIRAVESAISTAASFLKGDTLQSFLGRHGVDLQSLKQVNPGVNLEALTPGAELKLPGRPTAIPAETAAPAAQVEPTSSSEVQSRNAEATLGNTAARYELDRAEYGGPPGAPPPSGSPLRFPAGSSGSDILVRQDSSMSFGGPADPKKDVGKQASDAGVNSGKGIGAGKDAVGIVDKGVSALSANLQRIDQLTGKVGEYQKELGALAKREKELVQLVKSGKITRGDVAEEAFQMKARTQAILKEVAGAEKEIGNVTSELGAAERQAMKVKGLNTKIDSLTNLKSIAGKGLIGIDMASNFAELMEKDPAHWEKNAAKAVTMTMSKMGVDSMLSGKMGVSQAAVGVLQFGLERMGLGDSAMNKSLTVAAQAFPGDAVAKGVAQAIDQGAAWTSLVKTGSTKELEDLNSRNLKGDNGLVIQGAAVLGDLLATGGKNVPAGDAIGLAESLGIYGHVEIDTGNVGKTTPEKMELVNKLAEGVMTDSNDSLKLSNILHTADGRQTAYILAHVDQKKLLESMRIAPQSYFKNNDPAANLLMDVYHKASREKDPEVRRDLFQQFDKLLDVQAGRGQRAMNQLRGWEHEGRFNNLPPATRAKLGGLG
jgi:LysM repeat protein